MYRHDKGGGKLLNERVLGRPCATVVARQRFEERESLLTPILRQVGQGRLADCHGKMFCPRP